MDIKKRELMLELLDRDDVEFTVRFLGEREIALRKPSDSAEAPPSRLSKIGQALATLTEHPEWTNEQVAEAAGCHVVTLSKSRRFRDARKIIKGNGQIDRRDAQESLEDDLAT